MMITTMPRSMSFCTGDTKPKVKNQISCILYWLPIRCERVKVFSHSQFCSSTNPITLAISPNRVSVQLKHLYLRMNNLQIVSRVQICEDFLWTLFHDLQSPDATIFLPESSLKSEKVCPCILLLWTIENWLDLLFASVSLKYLPNLSQISKISLRYLLQILFKYLNKISTFRNLKKYIKTASCYPELCERRDYRTIMNDFQDSEKVWFSQLELRRYVWIKGAFADVGWRGKSSNSSPLLHEGGPGSLQQQVLAPGPGPDLALGLLEPKPGQIWEALNKIQSLGISWIPLDVPSSSLREAKITSSNLYLCHQLFLRACPKCDTFLDRKFIQISAWLLVEKPSATHSFCLHLLSDASTCVQIFFTCLCFNTWRHILVKTHLRVFLDNILKIFVHVHVSMTCVISVLHVLCCVWIYMQQSITCWNKRSIPKHSCLFGTIK